jgi:hypothetical protein
MPDTAIGLDVDEAPEVQLRLTPKVALDQEAAALNRAADAGKFLVG